MYFPQFLGFLLIYSLFVQAVPPLQFEALTKLEKANDRSLNIRALIEPKYRLPGNIIPLSYKLYITPILDDEPELGERFTAPAEVMIRVKCVESTSIITLHSFLLNINHNSITVMDVTVSVELQVSDEVVYDEEKHFYNITVSPPLTIGSEYDISIAYTAPVSTDRASGIYLTNYVDPTSGVTRYQAMTQLEPARGRQLFPCFDEPGYKSIFYVAIGRKENYIALANSPLILTEPMIGREGWFVDSFNATVPMPTYLFALSVCDFTFQETNVFRVPVRSYGPKHWIDEGAGVYSAEVSARTLQFFEQRYNASYAMPKLDSIVVPGKGGAMENWGLVTYGNWLMYFNGVTTELERWSLNSIIGHELAHQWFGNLVTCKTWSNIWLNEGITTYVSYIGVEQESPEFEPRKYIVNDAHQNALIYDAGPNSHPMYHNANTTAEILEFFSSIVYDKGAAIVRMMEGFLTEATLHAGLRNFLQAKVHDVAEQDELFEELTKQAHADNTLPSSINVKQIMDTWTLQKGFPLVRVSRVDSQSIIISQETFTNNYTGPVLEPEELWEVPISYATKLNPDFNNHIPKLWIQKNVTSVTAAHDTNAWIILNTDSTGFYRVLYDNYLTAIIQMQLQEDHNVISALSRSQLIDDYFNLAFQGYISVGNAFPFLMYLDQETEFTVWVTVFTNLRKSFILISNSDAFNGFRTFLSPRLGGALEKIGVEQQPEDKGALVLLRVQLLDWACTLENELCQEYASRLFTQWQSNPQINPIPIDIQQVVYCSGVAAGGETEFNFALQRYRQETSTTQKSRLLNALTCSNQPALLNRLLALALDSNSGLEKSDAASVISLTGANSVGRPLVLDFLQNSTSDIITFFGNANAISSTVQNLALFLGSSEELQTLTNYIEDNRDALESVMSSLNSSTATIQDNIQWMNKYFIPIKSWFDAFTNTK